MRVSYKWLQEYVDLKGISPQELADKMTLSGVTVEHLDELGKGIEKVVTGRIEKIERHPNADKLLICQLNVGQGDLLQIVTGASNVAEGQVVPVALVGAKLPIGLAIKKSKLRGVESLGMLCSTEELAIDKKLLSEADQAGIYILPADTEIGLDIKDVLGLSDVVLELELTPNRADCLSMVGVAREVAAVLGTEFKPPIIAPAKSKEKIDGQIKITIADAELCSRYVAKLIKDVQIGPSPQWMKQRLQAAGVRPINNVVDITNYVMLELGQPLHAFDYETLAGKEIIVRRAEPTEKITSLDGQDRKLDAEMLVIADAEKPVAIAGVMGGLETEVTAQTKNILLESAYFNGTSIRRTSRRLGLRSESSMRFEKGIDLGGCLQAAERASQLYAELAGGKIVSGAVDNQTVQIKEPVITLTMDRLNKYMGAVVPKEAAVSILKGLQFQVKEKADSLVVTVPTARPDISLEEDLIEEVIRIYGYDKVPTTLPVEATTQGSKTRSQTLEELIKDVMVGCGLTEVINLSFINQQLLNAAGIQQDSVLRNAVIVQNPLSEDQGILRTTLVPGMLEVLKRNLNRRVKDAAIFELGKAFWPKADAEALLPDEPLMLVAAGMGSSSISWAQSRTPYDFYFLKGILETLFVKLGITDYRFVREAEDTTYHPGRTAAVLLGDKQVGVIGQLHPDVAENFELPAETCLFQVNLDEIMAAASLKKGYKSLPKFPGVDRDLAIVVKDEVAVESIYAVIRANGGPLLQEVSLFDVFRGKQIESGFKSLALSLRYQAQDRTLVDEEVNSLQQAIAEALAKETGAVLR